MRLCTRVTLFIFSYHRRTTLSVIASLFLIVIAVSQSPEPFASCHSERSEESHSAQDRLREGEAWQSYPSVIASGAKQYQQSKTQKSKGKMTEQK